MGPHRENRHEGPNEAERLLSPPAEAQDASVKPSVPSHQTRCSWPWKYVVMLGIGLAVVSDIGEYLFLAPRIRLFESVICTDYYLQTNPSLVDRQGSVPEHLCKINPVQDKVAFILGWQLFFESIPAILLPIPFGYLADKHGRKWILFFGLMGYTLSMAANLIFVGVLHLPIQYVWLSSLFHLIGGGPAMGTTMLTTIVADVVPPELRSTAFFYRFSADLIAEFSIPLVTSILMTKNIWIPLVAAVLFQGLATLTALFVPETLPIAIPEAGSDISNSSLNTPTSDLDEEPIFDKTWKTWIRKTRESFSFITRDTAVAALVFTFLISKVGRQSINILLQYVSTRYGWSLSQAGLLLSLRAGVNVALFTIILPTIATLALSRTSAVSRDLWIAKVSIILMILGTIILFSSATPALMIIGLITYTLGTGFVPIVRSLVTFLVESHHASSTTDIARLYSVISVMEGIGSLLAGPGIAWAFRIGISLGTRWLGLPYGLAAVLFVSISVVVFNVRL